MKSISFTLMPWAVSSDEPPESASAASSSDCGSRHL